MNLIKNTCYHGFMLIEEYTIEEVKGIGRVFEHQKSGAKLIHIENEDSNKVFTITFKTLPSDNTGVAHIVEHAVCCASKKYPLKDTFVEMDKGSLSTALNACTYKDMTMYYCASQNARDLLNLMEVYMDLVFNPLMFERTMIFKQEGWHYCLEELSDAITYNGIVYNEMKGEYAEPTAILDHEMHQVLFPDTVYRFDSGGIPDAITTLDEKAFEAFYRRYYTAQNATLYLYGDGDLMAQLALLDEVYLGGMTKAVYEQEEIPLQPPLKEPQRIIKEYATAKGEEVDDQLILTLGFVVGEVTDSKERLAFQILEHMLLKSAASPVAQRLVSELSIGKVLEEVGYDPGKRQPTFTFTLSGAKAEGEQVFEQEVLGVLESMVNQGIDQELLEASLHTVTFALCEGESQSEPKGVLYSEDIQMSMLYGGEPFAHIAYQKDLDELARSVNTGYFEQLIKTYFLENNHRALVILRPNDQLLKSKEEMLRKELKAYKKTLTKSKLKQLIKMNKALDDFQEEPTSLEYLTLLPSLKKSDLKREIEPITLIKEQIQGVPVIWQELQTQGIGYVHLLFDASVVAEEDIPYIGILANVLTYVGTTQYSYQGLENAINRQTGGINCSINAYGDSLDTDVYQSLFKISGKVLSTDVHKLLDLLEEIMTKTQFDDRDKLQEIISYVQYEMERSFTGAPEYRAVRRLYTYFSKAAVYEDLVSGLVYYDLISKLTREFDQHVEQLIAKLQDIYHKIMSRGHLKLYVTCEESVRGDYEQAIQNWLVKFPDIEASTYQYELQTCDGNEGFITANEVQAIAKGYNFKKAGYRYSGALHVVSQILNSTYLWDKVRLQGGAYGCEIALGRDGNMVICSYCDPSLLETLEVFDEIGEYLRTLVISEEELLKYTIGTIGAIDYPMTMEQKSERAIAYDLCGLNLEMLQEERDQILDITPQDIVGFAELFEAMGNQDHVCVIGSAQTLDSQKQLFKTVRTI
ncbi:MAG: insulinase family protein [Cellulosilyticaceae bacterium]